MEKELISKLKQSFDEIAHTDDSGVEFWYARELQSILGYSEWRNFTNAIEKAKASCAGNDAEIQNHFVNINKMVGREKTT